MTEWPTYKIGKVLLIALAAAVTCLLIALLFTYWYVPRTESKSHDFQAYAPQKLPVGIHPTTHATTNLFGGMVKTVMFNTNNAGLHISEQKMSRSDYNNTFGSCNFKRSTNTCIGHHTPRNVTYEVLTVTNNSGKPSLQTVHWLRNGTELEIDLMDAQANHYSPDSWGPVIDSFVPVQYGYERGTFVKTHGG